MFPYRRGGKKRQKGGPPGRHGQDRGGQRRMGGGAYDVLNLMPSTTKALAQMLAGNTRASGQLAHARNILAQAERMIEERQIDRLMPIDRESFLEQLARLKLTLAAADADEEAQAAAPAPEAEPKSRPSMAPERLRELALSLAGELAAGAQRKAEVPPPAEPTADAVPDAPAPRPDNPLVTAEPSDEQRSGSAHQKPRLRLKRKVDLAEAER
jgi:hypothetical protein